LFLDLTSLVGLSLLFGVPRSHSITPLSVDYSGRVISPTQRPLPDNALQSQEADIHAPFGIRTRSRNN